MAMFLVPISWGFVSWYVFIIAMEKGGPEALWAVGRVLMMVFQPLSWWFLFTKTGDLLPVCLGTNPHCSAVR